jgi:hypothetical protein
VISAALAAIAFAVRTRRGMALDLDRQQSKRETA